MKPHPRIRKTIKWGGAAVTVVLVVVWIGSGWCFARWCPKSEFVAMARGGQLWLYHNEAPIFERPAVGFDVHQYSHPVEWGSHWEGSRSDFLLKLALWQPCLITAIVTLIAWRLDTLARRRARLNLCPKCHYDRTGLAAGVVCPECGAASG